MGREDIDELLSRLARLALTEYPEIVVSAELVYGKLRIHLLDGSFIDVWLSRRLPGRYAVHCGRRHIDGTIYRWDNTPHEAHRRISTFPHHFHERSDRDVKPYRYPGKLDEVLIHALETAKSLLGRHRGTED